MLHFYNVIFVNEIYEACRIDLTTDLEAEPDKEAQYTHLSATTFLLHQKLILCGLEFDYSQDHKHVKIHTDLDLLSHRNSPFFHVLIKENDCSKFM
ncbi:hypothetical protein TNIN_160521 [Trichonephila inaurata madagascariensis]|uniref:Uncharacterized protein n=1 Tax=Trichonephila inaurata madagascariensis TaxID=2747483 RepID=A0A8X6I917_9ARAC|nr:hypothetical protein TNIN_160521 [Trichonephila inaurata madagascariensis]